MNIVTSDRREDRRILVVDDEPFVLIVLQRLLRESSFFVGAAHSGAEALEVFSQGPWDLVITDRAMPEMDGEQLAERIKKAAPGTPVILITGYARPGTAMELFDAVLAKPFSKEDLLASVGRVLDDRAESNLCASDN
jgi:two-component system cell cycle sensor histidine kinase/response regulator CckA